MTEEKISKKGSYLTVILRDNDKEDPTKFAINQLAKVVSYLEDRLASIEKIILLVENKRGIRIKNENN